MRLLSIATAAFCLVVTLSGPVNAQVGKTQRLAGLRFIDELPRSPIGKVLKRELRDLYVKG